MNRQYVLAIAFFGIAACTTSGPGSPTTGAMAETSVIASNQTEAEAEAEAMIGQGDVPEAPLEETIEDEDELICTKERLTGSRIPTKVCLTRAERERLQKEAQAYIEKDRRKPGSNVSK